MARRRIILTEHDHACLEALLASEFARAVDPCEFLDDLRAELDRAEIVRCEDLPAEIVTMNSIVVLRDVETQGEETYTLVSPDDANIAHGRLSVLTPVGAAILGGQVGDRIPCRVAQGWRTWKVERVFHLPPGEATY